MCILGVQVVCFCNKDYKIKCYGSIKSETVQLKDRFSNLGMIHRVSYTSCASFSQAYTSPDLKNSEVSGKIPSAYSGHWNRPTEKYSRELSRSFWINGTLWVAKYNICRLGRI